jgi:Protein of unknown function (DUF3455)
MMKTLSAAATAVMLSAACTGMHTMPPTAPYSQNALPEAVKVPAGHRVAMETVGVGQITYECRAKAATATTAAGHEWVFVGPQAVLNDRNGRAVGKYYGPPATWESMDGSRLTATQLATAPAGAGNIPLQLVKADAAMGAGMMTGVSHIQRVATLGGTAPALACGGGSVGQRQLVNYQADYIFWKAA